jgi:hypothetical protein
MPKRKLMIVAERRAAGARRIVSAQRKLVKRLEAAGQSTLAAEQALATFVSALRHLEAHKRRVRGKA